MAATDWKKRAYQAAAVLIIFSLTIVSPISATLDQARRDTDKHAAETQRQYREAGIRFSLLDKKAQEASTDERERARADRKKSDLGAQWATARWTQYQFFVGIYSLVGLGFTVWFARQAWIATARSAKADEDALADTRALMCTATSARSRSLAKSRTGADGGLFGRTLCSILQANACATNIFIAELAPVERHIHVVRLGTL